MQLKRKYLFIFCLILISSFVFAQQTESFPEIHLITKQKQFEVSSDIILEFSNYKQTKPLLYCSNSYGSTLVSTTVDHNTNRYKIPSNISNKTGIVNWKLLVNDYVVKGHFNIISKQKVATLETYLGPPSIQAGETDFTMLVVIPTDEFDNPLQDSTQVQIKHLFLKQQYNDSVYIKHGMSYKTLYSKNKSGRMLISSEVLGFNSKEYTANILPAIPTDFKITYHRHHDYADGNQITTFSTSIIKDKYGNIVSDGTYVEFFITNTSNAVLKTTGTTINGIATAKMIHPSHEEQWIVKAFIEGMAESNTIELIFKPIISDFEVAFSENNRTITVGPLNSFMEQMVPDGLEVSLSIYKKGNKIKTLSKGAFEGYATFKLDTNNFLKNTYTFKIEAAGIEKNYANIKL